jgi:hypothetical protein
MSQRGKEILRALGAPLVVCSECDALFNPTRFPRHWAMESWPTESGYCEVEYGEPKLSAQSHAPRDS